MNNFSRTCGSLTVAEIQTKLNFLYSGVHQNKRRHAAVDEETTNNVWYTPNVLSIQELMYKAKDLLTETYGKK